MQNQLPDVQAIKTSATLLNAECEYTQADALILEAIERYPATSAFKEHFVILAQQRSDYLGVIERSEQFRRSFPGLQYCYSIAVQALRTLQRLDEAEELLAVARERFTGLPWLHTEAALLAEARGDWRAADASMAALRELQTGQTNGWIQSARSLMRSGRMSLAEELLVEALQAFENDPDLLLLHASVAEGTAKWDEADRRWRSAMMLHPDRTDIALRHALTLSTPPVALQRLRNWPEVFRRLDDLHVRLPQFAEGYSTHIKLLRERGDLAASQALADEAMSLFPHDSATAIESARVALAQHRGDDAIQILRDTIAVLPNDVHVRAELSIALRRAGRLDEAEAVCRAAIVRLPYQPRPYIEFAETAAQRGDHQSSLERWMDGARRFPHHNAFQQGIAKACMALIDRDQEETVRELASDYAVPETAGSLKELLLHFESLGGEELSCQLGHAQQRAGANPLSLFRWSSVSMPRLIDALTVRFEGIGTRAQTSIVIEPNLMEYYAVDRRFGFRTHTFVHVGDLPEDQLLEQTCRRMSFLVGKLLRELSEAKKIFVFYSGSTKPDQAQIEQLHGKLREFGDTTLLCIAQEDAGHPTGTVEVLRPGLLLAYVGATQAVGLINTSVWHSVCRTVYDMTQAQRSQLVANG